MSKTMPRSPWWRSISTLLVPYKLPCTSAHSRKAPASISFSNSERETKWYSLPSVSLSRGLRVVCEMLKVRPFTSASRRAVSVVLPAPEGDEMIRSSGRSLDILDLLPDLLELALDVHYQMRKLHILAFRAQRVGLA